MKITTNSCTRCAVSGRIDIWKSSLLGGLSPLKNLGFFLQTSGGQLGKHRSFMTPWKKESLCSLGPEFKMIKEMQSFSYWTKLSSAPFFDVLGLLVDSRSTGPLGHKPSLLQRLPFIRKQLNAVINCLFLFCTVPSDFESKLLLYTAQGFRVIGLACKSLQGGKPPAALTR